VLRAAGVLPITIFVALSSWGQDAPHWESSHLEISCTSPCHVPHQAQGALTAAEVNINLCQSCHNPVGLAGDLPISNTDKAVHGDSGTSHAFDVAAINVEFGAERPTDTDMNNRVMGDNIVCSTCHNQHESPAAGGGTPRVGNAMQVTALGSTGTVASGGVFSGPEGVWYLVEIVQGGNENNSRFCYSKDRGISWFPTGCDPPGTIIPNLTADGATPVALDNGVTVSFGVGSYAAQEAWEFAAAWPFLRTALGPGGSGFCTDCHRSWDMDHTAVETWDGNPKSHPVGVALNINGRGHDRAVPLDGNGSEQGSAGADANPTNDLVLFDSPNDVVQCLTCHGVHYVDSNTQTLDEAPR
jgi:predicted CXXCH cytochrome family protein